MGDITDNETNSKEINKGK